MFDLNDNFYSMNILEDETSNIDQLLSCKTAYLEMENQWMLKQQEFINQLIFKYKQIIATHSSDDPSADASSISQEIKDSIEAKKAEYKAEQQAEIEVDDQQITEEEFANMLGSYHEKLEKLQSSIKDREIELQRVEEGRNKQEGFRQRRFDLRFLGTVETNGKLIDKVRRDVAKLRAEKARLQNELIATRAKDISKDEQTLPSRIIQQRIAAPKREEEQVSTFENVVMIIKKKRFTNDLLEQRIRKLKNKCAQKQAVNQKLKQQIERLEWGCFDNVPQCNGIMDSSSAEQDISIFDKTFNNNVSFSIDVSRFIRPKLTQ